MSMLSLRSKLHSAIRQTRKPSTSSNPSTSKGVAADASNRSSSGSSSSNVVPPLLAGSLSPSSSSSAGRGTAATARPGPGPGPGDSCCCSAAPHNNTNISLLATLPAELLRKIASYCDIADILSLSRTGRQLRDVLDDPFVFQESLRLHMAALTTTSTPGRDALVDALAAQLADDDAARSVWESFAVAIRRRANLKTQILSLLPPLTKPDRSLAPESGGGDQEVVEELEANLGVLSTLLVLGYPDICDLELGYELMGINPWTARSKIWPESRLLNDKQLSLQLAFCTAMCLLQPADWTPVKSQPPNKFKLVASALKREFQQEQMTLSNAAFSNSWDGLQTRSLQLAAVITYLMKAAEKPDLPLADRIPFINSISQPGEAGPRLKLPLLDRGKGSYLATTAQSWQEWYTSRVREMIKNIEDEDWYGYYIYALNIGTSSDPAMEAIRFKTGAEDAKGNITLEAKEAMDGIVRGFDFGGSINRTTGVVSLKKQYIGAHQWSYEGVMTPLGIVGEWGRANQGMFGHFWLYKRSWIDNDTKPERQIYY